MELTRLDIAVDGELVLRLAPAEADDRLGAYSPLPTESLLRLNSADDRYWNRKRFIVYRLSSLQLDRIFVSFPSCILFQLTRRNKYFRTTPLPYGLVSLGGFFRFWAVVFIIVTIGIAIYKTEDPVTDDEPDMDVKKVYTIMWNIVRLKSEDRSTCEDSNDRHSILTDCSSYV